MAHYKTFSKFSKQKYSNKEEPISDLTPFPPKVLA